VVAAALADDARFSATKLGVYVVDTCNPALLLVLKF
jgi:hypothetical protein